MGKRELSEEFMSALMEGILKPILLLVKADNTLDLQIRNDYINIYYRGGSLVKIERKKERFRAWFDKEGYMRYTAPEQMGPGSDFPLSLETSNDVMKWIEAVPFLKHAMDMFFTVNPHEEREIQQLIVRENNYGRQAKSTDYFICDIEYAQPGGNFRFDMIAVRWPSTASAKNKAHEIGLAFIEVKNGDGAMIGKAGISKHIYDLNGFLETDEALADIKEEMKKLFEQKRGLGLIDYSKDFENFGTTKPEYIFILSNHDPEKSHLHKTLDDLPVCGQADLRFAVSNFMGFGLYDQGIYSLEDFKKTLITRVLCK